MFLLRATSFCLRLHGGSLLCYPEPGEAAIQAGHRPGQVAQSGLGTRAQQLGTGLHAVLSGAKLMQPHSQIMQCLHGGESVLKSLSSSVRRAMLWCVKELRQRRCVEPA